MKSVSDPDHGETVGKSGHHMWAIVTLELDSLIEIIDGFSEPQADDQKRGNTCRGFYVSARMSRWGGMFLRRTDHETKNANPSTGPLDHGLIKYGP